jgi:hypothetical protein
MATEKLEELTTGQLMKKEKFMTRFLLICFIIIAVCVLGMIYIKGMGGIYMVVLFMPLLPIAIGRKKILEELKKRENIS